MENTEARLLALENTVKKQQEAIDSFDRMFISTLLKFQTIDEDLHYFGQTLDTMIMTEDNLVTKTLEFNKLIKKLLYDVAELTDDFNFRKVRKQTDMLN